MKPDHLPRQARDTHNEPSPKIGVVTIAGLDYCSGDLVLGGRNGLIEFTVGDAFAVAVPIRHQNLVVNTCAAEAGVVVGQFFADGFCQRDTVRRHEQFDRVSSNLYSEKRKERKKHILIFLIEDKLRTDGFLRIALESTRERAAQ